MIANTPTSKVEEYLGNYQKLDKNISLSYMQLSNDEDIDNKYKEEYQKLIENQYKGLLYEIKDEKIDGESATVTTQVKVYDYKEILDKYNRSNNNDKNHEIIIKEMKEQKDKITYTIDFKLEKNNKDEWEVLELNLDDYKKLLGIN